MNNQITAKEAYVIASGAYEKEMKKKIEETLCSIYYKIQYAIKNGRMDTNVGIDIVGNEYREKLSSHLKEKGFKTSFHYDEIDDGGLYIFVSWRHIENEK